MSDLPTQVEIHEEGPREGFEIEPGPISTADKTRLIEALAETDLVQSKIWDMRHGARRSTPRR